jgi:hypothetical protein
VCSSFYTDVSLLNITKNAVCFHSNALINVSGMKVFVEVSSRALV